MYLFTFSGTAVLLGMGGVCLLIALGVYSLRLRMRSAKAGAADLFGYSPTIYRVSLCAAIFTSLLVINWTQYEEVHVYTSNIELTDEIVEIVPRTVEPPKPAPPPPPPPPVKIEPVVEDVPPMEMVDQSIEESDFVPPALVAKPRVKKPVPPPATPPSPPAEDLGIKEIFGLERMPTFGNECQALSGDTRKSCSDRELLTFVQKGLSYPAMARSNGIEGIVFVKFVVEKDGSVSGIEAVRGLPGGCTEAALQAIERINLKGKQFSPGIQNGQPVRVAFNLPIKFQLN